MQLISLPIAHALFPYHTQIHVITYTNSTSFSTDCPLSDLQGPNTLPDSNNYPPCQHNQDTVTTIAIPNGEISVTCYNGRQFVSVASYVCSQGYHPNVSSSVRVCRDNGAWSGTIIACGEQLCSVYATIPEGVLFNSIL